MYPMESIGNAIVEVFRFLAHHPGRYVRQSAIALLDDKHLGALKAMMPHKKGNLTKARMEPIVIFPSTL